MAGPLITNEQRRARFARRHALAPDHKAADALEGAHRLVCYHATDPSSVYLSARARVMDFTMTDMDHALYEQRSLVKHMAMRRTLFVFPTQTLPAAQAGASNRVADTTGRALARDVEKAGLHADGMAWIDACAGAVTSALDEHPLLHTAELKRLVPLLEGAITYGDGKSWGGKQHIGPRALVVLQARGLIVRGTAVGQWFNPRNQWAEMEEWIGEEFLPPSDDEGTAELVRLYLEAFGPATELDVKWWLGSTLGAVRKAFASLEVETVQLDGDKTGYVLPGDSENDLEPVEPWGALLPVLDPTPMGWFERDWYLGLHKPMIFDSVGNAGPTAWWNGRIVGGWRQDESGRVILQLLEEVGPDAVTELMRQARELDAWIGGHRVMVRFPSPLSKSRDVPEITV